MTERPTRPYPPTPELPPDVQGEIGEALNHRQTKPTEPSGHSATTLRQEPTTIDIAVTVTDPVEEPLFDEHAITGEWKRPIADGSGIVKRPEPKPPIPGEAIVKKPKK